MDYMHATLILNETGREINETNLRAVLEAAGAEVVESRVKAVVAAFEGVDIEAIAPAPEFDTPEPVPGQDGPTAQAPAVSGTEGGVEVETDVDTTDTEATTAGEEGGMESASDPTDADAMGGGASDEDRHDPEDLGSETGFEFSSVDGVEQLDEAGGGPGDGHGPEPSGGDDGDDADTAGEADGAGGTDPEETRPSRESEGEGNPSSEEAEPGDDGAG